jgi:DNA-binding NtrC family response regulator
LGLEGTNGGASATAPDNGHNLPPVSASGIDLTAVIEGIEKAYFEDALKLANGNESKAALLLNLTRDKFRYRRQKFENDC